VDEPGESPLDPLAFGVQELACSIGIHERQRNVSATGARRPTKWTVTVARS
jgi:hypothetical protein